jgi:hypothetical protein
MATKNDLANLRFGRWTVLDEPSWIEKRLSMVWCVCDCDTKRAVRRSWLLRGLTKSCGCRNTERVKTVNLKHGGHLSPEYRIWGGMKSRCSNTKDPKKRKNYADRGIRVCDRWLHSFENFLADMGERPSKQHTLDRINNDGNYEPSNCRWALGTVQHRNKRTTLRYEYKGEIKTAKEWSELSGIDYEVLIRRVGYGWSIERTLTTPVQKRGTPPLPCPLCGSQPEVHRRKSGKKPIYFFCPSCQIVAPSGDGFDAYDARFRWNRYCKSLANFGKD